MRVLALRLWPTIVTVLALLALGRYLGVENHLADQHLAELIKIH